MNIHTAEHYRQLAESKGLKAEVIQDPIGKYGDHEVRVEFPDGAKRTAWPHRIEKAIQEYHGDR